jgi:TonB family protein
MVHAQASRLAQPQAAQAPVLQSSLAIPAGLMLSSSADTPAPGSVAERISTGVVAPKLIKTVPVEENTFSATSYKHTREAMVSMIVDESGKPTNVKIVQSAGADLDRSIVESVKQYRYKPATVSGEVSPVQVNLHLLIREPAE